jgi:hypothetical protein
MRAYGARIEEFHVQRVHLCDQATRWTSNHLPLAADH